jgi:hypothetical protein
MGRKFHVKDEKYQETRFWDFALHFKFPVVPFQFYFLLNITPNVLAIVEICGFKFLPSTHLYSLLKTTVTTMSPHIVKTIFLRVILSYHSNFMLILVGKDKRP